MNTRQSINYVLAIDAGGTKTLGILKHLGTDNTWYHRTKSASLSHDITKSCDRIEMLAKNLVQQAQCNADDVLIICGVAGGGNSENRNTLLSVLNRTFKNIKIYNDGKTSLYGAGKGQPIIMLAMGTGSIAMRLDKDGVETRFGGWGFIAGDLGSGAYMGKQLVVNALVQYDKRQLKCDILINETIARLKVESSSRNSNKTKKNVKNDLKETEQQIIANWIKNATSTEYAAFAPLIFEYATRSEFAKNIIKDASYWIEDLAKTAGFKTEEHADIPIAIIGGLAEVIKPFLSNNLSDALVSPAGSSLDGALYLGEKHLSENFLERPTTTN